MASRLPSRANVIAYGVHGVSMVLMELIGMKGRSPAQCSGNAGTWPLDTFPGSTLMRFRIWAGLLTLVTLPVALAAQAPAGPGGQPGAPPRPALTLTTSAFADGAQIPIKYTQAGEQISPALAWTNVPPGTVSFVLHMRDPD